MSWPRFWTPLFGLFLFVDFSSQNKTQELHVTCEASRSCVLPCSFPPSSPLKELLWLRPDSAPLLRLTAPDQLTPPSSDDPLSGRVSVAAVAKGNASIVIAHSAPRDRGRYSCSVTTETGRHSTAVIVKVQAPIRSVSVELSRLSGYEEVKCSVKDVFPAPRVTWSTEPATFHDLRPVTRKQLDPSGLYEVDSRLRTLGGQDELIYICTATSPYGGPAWTSSYRHRDLRGYEGKDLTLPCFAPSFLNSETLSWTFSNSEDPKHILTYSVQSGSSVTPSGLSDSSMREWAEHVELDGYRVQLGDGSLRLMDPDEEHHTGRYSCVFSTETSQHTERLEVTISGAGKRSAPEQASYWWVVGLIIALLVLALVAVLVYFKMRGGVSKARSDPEEATELHPVKDSSCAAESGALSTGGTNGQSASALT